jgi:hypothetical protein
MYAQAVRPFAAWSDKAIELQRGPERFATQLQCYRTHRHRIELEVQAALDVGLLHGTDKLQLHFLDRQPGRRVTRLAFRY